MLSERDEQLCEESHWDFGDLSAIYINSTLKRSPAGSNTQGLADHSLAIMQKLGVSVDVVRAAHPDLPWGAVLRVNPGYRM